MPHSSTLQTVRNLESWKNWSINLQESKNQEYAIHVGTGDRQDQTKGLFGSWKADRWKCGGVRGFMFSGVFNSEHLKNAFRAVHILFMQFTELEVGRTLLE